MFSIPAHALYFSTYEYMKEAAKEQTQVIWANALMFVLKGHTQRQERMGGRERERERERSSLQHFDFPSSEWPIILLCHTICTPLKECCLRATRSPWSGGIGRVCFFGHTHPMRGNACSRPAIRTTHPFRCAASAHHLFTPRSLNASCSLAATHRRQQEVHFPLYHQNRISLLTLSIHGKGWISKETNHRSSFHALVSVIESEGVKGLYKGRPRILSDT
jgi:hypothetical protein